MANEFSHASPGTSLSQAEYESVVAHIVDSQARGDILISNTAATGWIRLAKGSQGATLYMNANDPAWLAPGTNGQVLTSGGAGANPAWASPAAGIDIGAGWFHFG